ncbi:hypothetical protein [Streptomyces sp. NPDC005969]|uniref:hypothetical protein n=1 Tax=Streptomyces sp. NPDC005969 TaxID=3156722 RepID=UPI003406C0CA
MDHPVTPSAGRRFLPSASYAVLAGFLLLLAAVFALSYGVGRLAGPVAPDMRGVFHGDDAPDTGHMGGMEHGDGH